MKKELGLGKPKPIEKLENIVISIKHKERKVLR